MAGRYQGCHVFQDTGSGGHLNIEVFLQTSGWFWRRVEDSAPRSEAVGPFTTSTEAYEGAKATNLTLRGARLRPASFSMAMILRDIESGMASQFKFVVDVRDDGLLIVTEERSAFFAMYEMRTDRPQLALVRRSPTADHELLAAAFQAAVNKARELGWIV